MGPSLSLLKPPHHRVSAVWKVCFFWTPWAGVEVPFFSWGNSPGGTFRFLRQSPFSLGETLSPPTKRLFPSALPFTPFQGIRPHKHKLISLRTNKKPPFSPPSTPGQVSFFYIEIEGYFLLTVVTGTVRDPPLFFFGRKWKNGVTGARTLPFLVLVVCPQLIGALVRLGSPPPFFLFILGNMIGRCLVLRGGGSWPKGWLGFFSGLSTPFFPFLHSIE